VYPVLLAGLSSRSSYARLGGVRATAQFLSYELAGGSIILAVSLLVGSFNLNDIFEFQDEFGLIIPIMPAALIFLIVSLAGRLIDRLLIYQKLNQN
jgi:NADH-quinone oxidoreductase subunit H